MAINHQLINERQREMSASDDTLGKITKFVANAEKWPKVAKFALKAVAESLLPNERINICCRIPLPMRAGVDIIHSAQKKSARYGGLMKCGLGWVCPLCQARLAEKRRAELEKALEYARNRFAVYLVTYTVRHERSDDLGDLLTRLNSAYRIMRQQRKWRWLKDEFALVGEVRATEVTYSNEAGFHPHYHVLVFIDLSQITPATEFASVLELQIWLQWIDALAKVGLTAEKNVGVKVQNGLDAAGYITKYGNWSLGQELTSQARKKPRGNGCSIWDLLLLHYYGDKSARALFLQYHAATKGKSQIQWSPGLRERLLLDYEEPSDTDEPESDERVLTTLTLDDWKIVLRESAEGALLDRARDGDCERVARFLLRLRARADLTSV